jgi:hypothetical protein
MEMRGRLPRECWLVHVSVSLLAHNIPLQPSALHFLSPFSLFLFYFLPLVKSYVLRAHFCLPSRLLMALPCASEAKAVHHRPCQDDACVKGFLHLFTSASTHER